MQYTPMTLTIVKALDITDMILDYSVSSFITTDISDENGVPFFEFITSTSEPGYFYVMLTTPTCYFDIDSFSPAI